LGGGSPCAGAWGNPVPPFPRPREGLGGRSPPKNKLIFIATWCGAAAWTAEVTIVRCVQPPSQPSPAGGRSRVPAPGGGESGRGPAPCPRRRGAGGTPALPGHVHRGGVRHAHDRLTLGEPGSPIPPLAGGFGRATPSRRGLGKPGFPSPPPAGEFGRA